MYVSALPWCLIRSRARVSQVPSGHAAQACLIGFPCFNQYWFVGLYIPPYFPAYGRLRLSVSPELFQRVVWMTDIIAGGSLAKRPSLFIKASHGSKAENVSGISALNASFDHFATDGLSTRSCSPGNETKSICAAFDINHIFRVPDTHQCFLWWAGLRVLLPQGKPPNALQHKMCLVIAIYTGLNANSRAYPRGCNGLSPRRRRTSAESSGIQVPYVHCGKHLSGSPPATHFIPLAPVSTCLS
ncbi:hypothetical protein EV421DRAFT_1481632 [Armillaria borealis]|uniref:Uncharacterized protein n=1 Tax=Armillaria borealis TaxID=47425 RepID=A0AA39JTP2_9AGAR|nr:hypothetical protein EV421DRAFT_1481632 [Armillaria borealis]